MTQVRKWLPRVNVSSHGRGHRFESCIAHREKPLLSGGFFASGVAAPGECFYVQGRGQRRQDLILRLTAGLWGVGVERFAPRVGCGVWKSHRSAVQDAEGAAAVCKVEACGGIRGRAGTRP